MKSRTISDRSATSKALRHAEDRRVEAGAREAGGLFQPRQRQRHGSAASTCRATRRCGRSSRRGCGRSIISARPRLTTLNTGGTDHMPFDAIGLPGFQFIQDPLNYESQGPPLESRPVRGSGTRRSKQASAILASFVYHAAMRDAMLPRKPLPKPHPDAKDAKCSRTAATVALIAALCSGLRRTLRAQSRPLVAPEAAAIYQRLLPQISRIKIFDHHAHPGFAGRPGGRSGAGAGRRAAVASDARAIRTGRQHAARCSGRPARRS